MENLADLRNPEGRQSSDTDGEYLIAQMLAEVVRSGSNLAEGESTTHVYGLNHIFAHLPCPGFVMTPVLHQGGSVR